MSGDPCEDSQPGRSFRQGAEWIAEGLADIAKATEGQWSGQGLAELVRAVDRVAVALERQEGTLARIAAALEKGGGE